MQDCSTWATAGKENPKACALHSVQKLPRCQNAWSVWQSESLVLGQGAVWQYCHLSDVNGEFDPLNIWKPLATPQWQGNKGQVETVWEQKWRHGYQQLSWAAGAEHWKVALPWNQCPSKSKFDWIKTCLQSNYSVWGCFWSSMPSMKKLVTRVTGTVRIGPATGYIANGLGSQTFIDSKYPKDLIHLDSSLQRC